MKINFKILSSCLLLPLLLTVLACTPEKEPIRYGEDTCARCKMGIVDEKFGSEMVTVKGKIYKFDSIECLVAYHSAAAVPHADVHSLWITPYTRPNHLIAAGSASYLQSQGVPSPMGKFLSGYTTPEEARQAQQQHGGEIYTWEQLADVVRSK